MGSDHSGGKPAPEQVCCRGFLSGCPRSRISLLKAGGARLPTMHAPRPRRGVTTYTIPCADVEVSSARVRGTGRSLSQPVTDGTSGRVDHGKRDEIQQGRDPVQECFDGAGAREVEEDAVFVLFDLRCYFEECADEGGG